jgi:hypothetical protein
VSPTRTIPNVYHFVFGLRPQTEPFHLMFYLCLASCLAVNRPDRVRFYYQHEPHGPLWDRIRPALDLVPIEPARWLETYQYSDEQVARYRYAHLADLIRLQVLAEHGGIYADMDTLFLQPIPESWFSRQFILGHERPPDPRGQSGSLCNAWIASAPGAEFGRRWLAGMADAFDGSWSNHSTQLPYRMALETPDLLDVEPATAFCALDWTPRHLRDLLVGDVELPADARSLHLWSHLWFDDDRTDFSSFGARLLTPEYVRHARTTYACLARPHLPADLGGSRWDYWRQRTTDLLLHPRIAFRELVRPR